MAHELEIVNGKAQMAYVGQTPWHGLGVEVGPDLSPQEIAVAAGIDWKVEKHDLFFENQKGNPVRAGKKQALVRSSDGKYLDVVSEDWVPVQNEEAISFFDDYIKAGGMEMHTCGSLKDGQIIWALAKVNDSFSLFGGKDEVDSYLLLSNPHQFGRAVDIRFTPIRVVCNNTLSLSLETNTKLGISMNHRSEFDPNHARMALEEAHSKMNDYREMAEFLGTKKYNQNSVFEYFSQVFPKTNQKNVVSFDKMMEQLKKGEKVFSRNALHAMELLDDQPGAEYGKGSWWHAYNTVTYMSNHVLGRDADSRLRSNWFGYDRARNIDALGMAIEYANAA